MLEWVAYIAGLEAFLTEAEYPRLHAIVFETVEEPPAPGPMTLKEIDALVLTVLGLNPNPEEKDCALTLNKIFHVTYVEMSAFVLTLQRSSWSRVPSSGDRDLGLCFLDRFSKNG